jgi:uncharacterized protein (DUF2384 family)
MNHTDQVNELAALVQRMVRESGNPNGFDAQAWVLGWLNEPLPALGGRPPSEVLKEPDGFERISTVLARMQSGAYS